MRLRSVLCGLAVITAVSSFAAPVAQAHVSLVGSDPADATSLTSVPREVRLRFNEPLSPRFRQVHLIDSRGHRVAGTSLNAAADGRELTLRLPAGLRRGAYEVTWEALSQNDGHVTGGALVFGAGAPVGPVPRAADASGATTLDSVLRWVWLAAVLLMIGVVAFALVARAARVPTEVGAARARAIGRIARLLEPAAGVALVMGVAVFAREATTVPGGGSVASTAAALLGERWGLLWLAGEGLLVALLGLGLVVRRSPRPAAPLTACAAALVALSVVHVAGGHAANLDSPVAHVAAGAGHLLAAGIWLGGVTAFAVALWPAAGIERAEATRLARALRAPFGALAGAAVLVAVLTGLVSLGAEVASVDAVLTTSYGASLLVKMALVTLAGIVGVANVALLLRGGDRVARGGVARLMAIEVALGVGALLAVAEMTASAPPRGPEFDAPRPVRAPVLARQADDVLVTATARPNRVGTNVITVTTAATRRIYGAPVEGVSIGLSPQAGGAVRTIPLAATGNDRWTAGAPLPSAGGWRMSVRVRRPGGTLVAPLAWRVEAADQVLPVRYSSRRLAPLTRRLALLLAAGALLAGLCVLVLRRRSGLPGIRLHAIEEDLA